MTKRFFCADDGGCDYSIVAADLSHAQALLRDAGILATNDAGDEVAIDDPCVEWTELTTQDAARIRVALGGDGAGPMSVLAACNLGDWFSSEF